MAWTTITKPSAQTYTNLNPVGKEQYDQADIIYDSTTTYYDGLNLDQWTNTYKGLAWNISNPTLKQSLSVSSQDNSPEGLFFSTDGTKMYVLGLSNEKIFQYSLSTAWDISTATYSGVFLGGTSQLAIYFSPDGLRLYWPALLVNRPVRQYTLSTAWDVSTATLIQSKNIGANDSSPEGIFFKPDGSKMYITARTNSRIDEYALSNPWDISTLVLSQSFSIASLGVAEDGLYFRPDGRMFFLASSGNPTKIFAYNISTPWDISTSSFSQTFTTTALGTYTVFFKLDGSKMYLTSDTLDTIREYDLNLSWTNIAKPS